MAGRQYVAVGAMTFEEWYELVDQAILRDTRNLLGRADLPDQTFWDWWAAGVTPSEASRRTLRAAGWPE